MTAAVSSVWTWGRAKNYRLGRDAQGRDSRVPEAVPFFAGRRVRSAACGGGHTAVVTQDGSLLVFGYSQYGQLGLGDRTDTCKPAPVTLRDDTAPDSPPARAAAVACGRYHTLALCESGLVYTWGGGKNGRLGHADEKIRLVPRPVAALRGHRAVAIAAGYHNNLVLTASGDVWSWGWGAHGQLGTGDARDRDSPALIEDLAGMRVVSLACGDRHSFAVTVDGRAFAWGSNEFGQLGLGRRGDTLLSPALIVSLAGLVVTALSSGDRHSAALTSTGAVYTWGCGVDGQCGHGDLRDVPRPRRVEALAAHTITSVHCGHNFTLAATSTGDVYAWGNNTYGQLGDGGAARSALPVRVRAPGKVAVVACAHFHCVLITADGPSKSTERKGSEALVEETDVDVAASEASLRETLSEYTSRTTRCTSESSRQGRDLLLGDILRLSEAPISTSASSSPSSFSS